MIGAAPALDAVVAERLRRAGCRLWAAIMLALDADVCASILQGRPVLARNLDAFVLRHALRGEKLPEPDSYVRVRPGHLDAVAEATAAIIAAAKPPERQRR